MAWSHGVLRHQSWVLNLIFTWDLHWLISSSGELVCDEWLAIQSFLPRCPVAFFILLLGALPEITNPNLYLHFIEGRFEQISDEIFVLSWSLWYFGRFPNVFNGPQSLGCMEETGISLSLVTVCPAVVISLPGLCGWVCACLVVLRSHWIRLKVFLCSCWWGMALVMLYLCEVLCSGLPHGDCGLKQKTP